MRRAALASLALLACANPDVPPKVPIPPPAPDAGPAHVVESPIDAWAPDAAPVIATAEDVPDAGGPPVDAAPLAPEVWLRGSTHVHAKPSGDSRTPIPDVIAWYEAHNYDFIAITDHNRVSEIGDPSTQGSAALRPVSAGLIVLSGIELTYNPTGCLPAGDDSGRCRIHVNLIGVTGRTTGKLEWANRKSAARVDKYTAAMDQQRRLGGIAQINHPQWYWGMTADVLTEVARRGIPLVEIANTQFEQWNAGDPGHPSTEALWDAALGNGVMLWGVASDDAHDYGGGGKYPAGGGWIMVKARRDPQAIVQALARGRFYASTGVTLARAEVANDELVVEVASTSPGSHSIAFIENGRVVRTVAGRRASRALPPTGYVRAVVTRGDGKRAWIQPARRP